MRSFFILLLSILAVPLAGCIDDTPDYRFRLKVQVETPEGLKTGSSVIEVKTAISSGIPTPGAIQTRFRGEAVRVDLGQRGTLFALMQSNERRDWAGHIMFLLAPSGVTANGDRFLGRYRNMLDKRQEIELPQSYSASKYKQVSTGIPTLVTFLDPSDPKTVQLVNPEDLAATFGAGVTLRAVTVQMTDDPVTDEIEEHLEWMDDYRRTWFNGQSTVYEDLTTDELSAHLTAASFDTEFAR